MNQIRVEKLPMLFMVGPLLKSGFLLIGWVSMFQVGELLIPVAS